MTAITETRVDGIQCALAPPSGNRVAAGLLFRVGRADETLATSGITHLVEHLALHEHGLGELHYNGATADTYTHFHVQGTTADVVEYLNGVCASLCDLPVHRLGVEKEILRTEAAGRGAGPAPHVAMFRYGAQGFGLASYPEVGLPNLDAEAVCDWARRHFTRENAVLWITSDSVPEGLDLALPSGRRNPLPPVTSTLPSSPAWYRDGSELVHLNAVVPRSTAAILYTTVLSKALFRELRVSGGYSYTATADYVPRDREHATVVAMADCHPEKREAVVGGFVDVLARLRFGTITETELRSAAASALRALDEPDLAARLPGHAMNLLIGRENLSDERLRREIEATSTADLRAVAEQVNDTALVQVPDLGLDWAGLDPVPESSERRVHGREFPALDNDGWPRLVVGRDGVGLVWDDAHVTVRYRDVVAQQVYPDGGRRLTGVDGFHIAVEPTLFGVDDAALRTIDTSVPPSSVVTQPPRRPDQIPQPQPQPAEKKPRTPLRSPADDRATRPRRSFGTALAFWICAALAVLFLAVAVDISIDLATGGDTVEGGAGTLIVAWALFAVPAWAAYRRRRAPS